MQKGKKISKEDSWWNIEYYIKRNPDKSFEECREMMKQRRDKFSKSRPSQIEYWENLYPDVSHDALVEMMNRYKRENNYQCIEYYIKRYPDKSIEECREMLQSKIKSYVSKREDNSGVKNPHHRSRTSEFQRRSCSPMCIEFYQKKYPDKSIEECRELLSKQIELLKTTHTKENTASCIEYWLAKGFDEKTANEKLKNHQRSFTLDKCIAKYGEIEGKKRFDERQQKWQKTLHENWERDNKIFQSILAKNIIFELKKELDCIECEFLIDKYSFDVRYKNKLIEINGDYWHCNPKYFQSDFELKQCSKRGKHRRAIDIWEKDENKKQCALKNGFDLFVVWESDYNENPQQTIERCLNFLNEK